MVAFHRLTAYLLAALLLIGGALLIAFVVLLPGPYSLTAFDGQQFSFSPLTVLDKLGTILVGVLLLLVGVFWLAMEALGPPARQHLPVRTAKGSQAAISRQSVEQRLATALEQIPGVVQAVPRIRHDRSGTAVDAHLLTDAAVAVPALCEQAHALLVSTLEHDLGMQPGLLRVYVRHPAHPGSEDSAPAPA
jgi:hypothetical protein